MCMGAWGMGARQEKLAHFNTSEDLSHKIHALYQMLDADDNGSLT